MVKIFSHTSAFLLPSFLALACFFSQVLGARIESSRDIPLALASQGTGKVGLEWSDSKPAFIKNFVTSKVSVIHNSSPNKISEIKSLSLEFVPMLSGTTQIDDFRRVVKKGYAKHVIGFSEPDRTDRRSELAPEKAASLWKQLIEPLKNSGYSLISPSISSSSTGVPWLRMFFNQCQGCKVDAVAIHWYGKDPKAFISYLKMIHDTFNRPIWVTDFGCQDFTGGPQCTKAQAKNFIHASKEFMDKTEWVQKYFALGFGSNTGSNQLMNANGQPTDLGKEYIS